MIIIIKFPGGDKFLSRNIFAKKGENKVNYPSEYRCLKEMVQENGIDKVLEVIARISRKLKDENEKELAKYRRKEAKEKEKN